MATANFRLLAACLLAPSVLAIPQIAVSRRSLLFSKKGFFISASFVGNDGVDPLNLSGSPLLVPLRHAEVKHGRLAMLAAIGWPAAEYLHPLMSRALSLPSCLSANGCAPNIFNGGIAQPEVSNSLLAVLIVGAIFEAQELQLRLAQGLKLNEWANDSVAGELFFDPLNLATAKPVTERFELQQAEIINGRLAMLALAAYAVIETGFQRPLV